MNKKEELRNKILNLTKEYYKCVKDEKKEYKVGDRINYSGRYYDENEMINLVDSSLEFWLTSGRYTDEFENRLKRFLKVKYASFVNSGSSANLIAFMALTSPLLKDRRIKRKDEVITVACTFPTTVSPIMQYGAVPVFVDVTIPEYNIDVEMLEEALSDKTKAVMIAHTLGNPFNLKVIKDFCKKHNLWLIEDNCDALGSKYKIEDKWMYTGTIGDIGTMSFYPPHHMTTGEGGAVITNNPLLHKIIRSFRDWGRDCNCPSGKDNTCGHRFDGQFGLLPKGYDHKYVYSHLGYNLKATDMQASIGCAQVDKLDMFIKRRQENFKLIYDKLDKANLKDRIILPTHLKESKPSWFGFMITCINEKDRNLLVSTLEKNNIQTRMLFAGNIIKHPCFDDIRNNKKMYRVVGNLENTDKILNNSFWIGVYPGINEKMIEYITNTIISTLK